MTDEQKHSAVEKLVAEGKKAIALKQWEDGVAKYADALDIMRGLVGEFDPKMAPLLLTYGKALYELAFSQQGVMGKEEVAKEAQPSLEAESSTTGLIESADPIEEDGEADADAEGEGEDANEAEGDQPEEEEAPPTGSGEEIEDPEDDYNAAWEVLDVARTIYLKQVESLPPLPSTSSSETSEKPIDSGNEETRLCLAECYLALGDVSCETENFPQAVQDYTAALEIKSKLLPASSRALSSVHYQLATVLEFTPGRRSDALGHVEKAVEGFKLLQAELDGIRTPSSEIQKLSDKEKEVEKKDVESLMGDLEVKLEELKSAPQAEDLVSESINHLLGGSGSSNGAGAGASGSGGSGVGVSDGRPVNDLSGMVKKKKKPTANGANGTNGVNGAAKGVAQTAGAVLEKGKEAAGQVGEKVAEVVSQAGEAATKVAEGIEGGLQQVAEEVNGKRKADEEVGGEVKKAKAD